MMCTIKTGALLVLLTFGTASGQHVTSGEKDVVRTESDTDASEKAAQGVIEAVDAMRKTAAGDGSDRWANGLEETVLDFEEKKLEMKREHEEREARHEKERMALRARHEEELKALQDQHTHQNEVEKQLPESADDAARQVMEGAAEARKKAHGDGSDRFANGLEESILDLQLLDMENKRKAEERHALHEKQRQELRARHEEEMRSLHARHDVEKTAASPVPTASADSSQQRRHVDDATALRNSYQAMEKSEEAGGSLILGGALLADLGSLKRFGQGESTMPLHMPVPAGDSQDFSEEGQPAWALVLFIFIGAIVGVYIWQKHAKVPIVYIPGMGKIEPGRWMNSFLTGVKGPLPSEFSFNFSAVSPIIREEGRPMIPLQPVAGADYGVFSN